MAAPRRALLFENGAALGVFDAGDGEDMDRCRDRLSVVVMEPSGASFTHVRQDGSCHRQLSEFCRRDLVPQVAAVARFRNAHSPRPYISHRLHAQRESGGGSNHSGRRGRRAPSRLAQWPVAAATTNTNTMAATAAAVQCNDGTPAHPVNPSSCCTARANGSIEVRAVGGNARLTLSASRTVAEVDYAVAIPGPGGGRDTSTGGVMGNLGGEPLEVVASLHPSARKDRASRTWVSRQFLVGCSDTPREFSQALAAALRASLPPATDAIGGPGGLGGAGGSSSGTRRGGGKGFVASELPRPESRPDHPSWNTVQASPCFDGDLHLAPPGYGNLTRRAHHAEAPAATAGCLLSVDVMELAEGRGFAGELAAVVETTGGCTYRVVVGGGGGGGDGGLGRDNINVHVFVHADGTEVWLEGDFVRLVRPPSTTTAAPQDPPVTRNGERERQRDRLLHTSAASTIRFLVPVTAAAAPPLSLPPSCNQADSTRASHPPRGWTSMSLGEIASRALALRRQFVACGSHAIGTSCSGSSGSSSGRSSRAARHHPEVRIRPPTLLVPGEPTAATRPAPPAGVSRTAVRRFNPSSTSTRRLRALSPVPSARMGGVPAERSIAAPGATTFAGATVVVVESVDRGGASFVAYSDGRARGAFADRTIVTLGAPFHYLQHPNGAGTKAAPRGVLSPSGGDTRWEEKDDDEEEEEQDREIECIRPDGTVVRLTERSLDPRRHPGAAFGYVHGSGVRGLATGSTGSGAISVVRPRHDFGPTSAASASASVAVAALGHAGHGTLSSAQAAGECAAGSSGLTPYVVAVLRFAAWAATSPEERRAAARNGAAGRTAAAAEAERNRRFVDLQRLVKLAPAGWPRALPRTRPTPGAPHIDVRGSGGGGAVASGRRSGGVSRASRCFRPDAVCDKENVCGDSSCGERKQREATTPKGAAERNALVERLLEANREVLVRRHVDAHEIYVRPH
eukprot:g10391.t1